MKHEQFISIRPKAKERPRMTRRGFAYTPKRTLDYEKQVAEAYTGPMFESNRLALHLAFSTDGISIEIQEVKPKQETMLKGSVLRGDLDNYVKAVMDALNGVAYGDDKQIVIIVAEKK